MTSEFPAGALPASYWSQSSRGRDLTDGAVIEEVGICIHVNGVELTTLMATPIDQIAMALGFLRSEGFIAGLEDVAVRELSHHGTCVDLWLNHKIQRPTRTIRTSGCGGGLTFDDLSGERTPLASELTVSEEQIQDRYRDLRSFETLYPITRGVHASALCTADRLLLSAEDVGRHNTLDKLWGKAMLAGIATEGCLIVTTGRVSSEMLGKAAKMKAPIVVSRTSPTSRSIALAEAWNIMVAGYLRRGGMRVYTHPWRLRKD